MKQLMDEKRYTVSEAVRLIGVESHVLRYWEDELGIAVQRTAQGHRIYSQQNVALFAHVKQLKEGGLQLKAIRTLLNAELSADAWKMSGLQKETRPEENAQGEAKFRKSIQQLSQLLRAEREQIPDDFQEQKEKNTAKTGSGPQSAGPKSSGAKRAGLKTAASGSGAKKTGLPGAASAFWPEEDALQEEPPRPCEVVPTQEERGVLEKFTALLRQMMEEVAAEQNQKLEKIIAARLREELEEQYLQYLQAAREAAASQMSEKKLRERIRDLFRRIW